jgi:hypothetical protein
MTTKGAARIAAPLFAAQRMRAAVPDAGGENTVAVHGRPSQLLMLTHINGRTSKTMSETSDTATQPIHLFYSYAHEDEPFRHALDKHLSVLRRTGVIAPWHDRRISPGSDWAKEIDRYLDEAQLILLLVSADFLSSDYCWGVEMERALSRHNAGLARVIPIMVRPVDFEGVPFARLQALPRQAKPITQWRDQDARGPMSQREFDRPHTRFDNRSSRAR